jgi:hypothetical protein
MFEERRFLLPFILKMQPTLREDMLATEPMKKL